MKKNGPLLIASNHPNSFLDAIILASIFKQPIYSLARGDAFKGKFISRLLYSMNMLPVYRLSEGAENLTHNFTTFSSCIEIFKKGGIVLIFSEGRCTNEWHLRSLKKGTARLALTAWAENMPLEIIPLGINYSSFRDFGKNVYLNFGNPIYRDDINNSTTEGMKITEFNNLLSSQLMDLIYEIDLEDDEKRKRLLTKKISLLKKVILIIPATIGAIFHYPFYNLVKLLIKNKANDHFDSIVIGIFFMFYPLYILMLCILGLLFFDGRISMAILILLPFCIWSFLQLKKQ